MFAYDQSGYSGVEDYLIKAVNFGDNHPEQKCHNAIKLYKSKSFASLYEEIVKGNTVKENILQVEKSVMHRLII